MKWLIFIIIMIQTGYRFVLDDIKNKQRKKPLPIEVSDIYDKKRYESFLSYEKDYNHMKLCNRLFTVLVYVFYLFSPFLSYIDKLSLNVYTRFFVTVLSISLINRVVSVCFDYYATFKIEEKYGKNKKTKEVFIKDEVVETVLDFILSFILYIPCLYILEHIERWTNHFSITYTQSLMLCSGLLGICLILYLIVLSISYMYLRIQYTFTELEDNELRHKIEELMKDCPKKVKHIKVYNESKKSTGKNAFLLKMLWHKEFGIADNFLDENSEGELLAVLSHEIGHLKHKKNIFNYMKYIVLCILFILIVSMIPHGELCIVLSERVLESFGLIHMNYDVIFTCLGVMITPIMYICSLYVNYVSRREEYEADDQAVHNGYGEELITTFKRISSDELIDVYPADFIEYTSYDHPGMYHRIKHIQEEIIKRKP